MNIRTGIFGVSGYTGEELLKRLQHNEKVDLKFATSNTYKGKALGELYPTLFRWSDLIITDNDVDTLPEVDAVFLCLPAGQSFKYIFKYIDRNTKIIDLGADYRFSEPESYKKWYGIENPLKDYTSYTAYGLPEFFRNQIKNAKIVANPGCYPTSILLGIIPLLKEDIIESSTIIVDSKSGCSGTGRKPTERTHFININENIIMYNAGRIHRHVGEIEEKIELLTNKKAQIIFNPQIIPVNRGILSNIYCKLKKDTSIEEIYLAYEKYYSNEIFIKLKKDIYPSLKDVIYTNYCFIHVIKVENSPYITIVSTIDNLVKGASGQAIQNFNIIFGMEETLCLL